jgi:DNA-binding NarL/FixJ family response regulator
MTTVAICDIEPVALEGLRSLLESAGLRVVAALASLPAAMKAVRELNPSLLIVDKAFGIQAVMDWMDALHKSASAVAIIVWSSAVSEIDAIQLRHAGVQGVMRKTAPLSDLLSCIRSVAAGGTWMHNERLTETAPPIHAARSWPTVPETPVKLLQAEVQGLLRKTAPLCDFLSCIRSVAAGRTWIDDDRPTDDALPVRTADSTLTVREIQVMELVQCGLKNKEIGIGLGIRTGTVQLHLKHIFEKTGIRGRYSLAISGG